MVHNYTALQARVDLAKRDPAMKVRIGERFAMTFTVELSLAESDPTDLLEFLGHHETYWIELIYRDMENVITRSSKNDDGNFIAGSFVADEFLSCVKNRNLSKKPLFKVTPSACQEDIKNRLPDVKYIRHQAARVCSNIYADDLVKVQSFGFHRTLTIPISFAVTISTFAERSSYRLQHIRI